MLRAAAPPSARATASLVPARLTAKPPAAVAGALDRTSGTTNLIIMARGEDLGPSPSPPREAPLLVLRLAMRCCLAGDALCILLFAMAILFHRRIDMTIALYSMLAAPILLLLALLLGLWHGTWQASRSLAIETANARRSGSAISAQARELKRQYDWGTALCKLPRWRFPPSPS